jgi:hypothetical protein
MIYRVKDETINDNEDIEGNLAFGNETEQMAILV